MSDSPGCVKFAPIRAMEDITRLQSQIQSLLQQECYDSAEILGSLMMCRSKAVAADLPALGLGSHAESLVLYADALYGKGEYRRALTHYKQAEQHRRLGGGSRNRQVVQPLDPSVEAELKFKECKCYAKLDDPESALRCMAGVAKHRSLHMHLFIASLQRGLRRHRDAASSYKAALKLNPMALEAVTALAQLGVSQQEIWGTVGKASTGQSHANQAPSQPSPAFSLPPPPFHFSQTQAFHHDNSGLRTPGTQADGSKGSGSPALPLSPKDLAWLEVFVAAHAAAHAHVPLEAISKFNELEAWFRQSLHCLLHRAKLQFDADLQHEAEKTFDKAREADGECCDCGDYHALLLRQKGGSAQLSALSHRLMAMDQKRPEPWVAAALYCDLRGDKEKALVLVERALQLAPHHVLSYHVKGSLLLTLSRPELAIHTFLAAKELSRDVHSFKGLVDAYLAAHRYKEALGAAKDAVQAIPKNALTVTLVGQVLATLPDGAEKGKKAFQRALALQPLHADAILSLADLYMSSGDYPRCVDLLSESLKQLSHLDYLHTKLGDVYTLTEDYSDALAAYHHAISINPSSAEAQMGLERLEKLMRGADPDAEEAVEMAAEDAY